MRLPLADAIERAGFAAGAPVTVARFGADGAIEAAAAGAWPGGRFVSTSDRFYAASLAKQVTGAAVALLVKQGRLDPDAPIAGWLAGVPGWVGSATPRQLAHHLAGLPPAGELEARVANDWTESAAFDALQTNGGPTAAPGERYEYSNVGYILLAQLVAAISGQAFAEFVATYLLRPHGIDRMAFAAGLPESPQLRLMGPRLPLTHGDGGLWTAAPAFARWLQVQNADAHGLASIVEVEGRLNDGTNTGYGWGIGLRQHRGHRMLVHGGEWPGAAAKAVRCPALGLGIVAMAADGPFEAVDRLVMTLLDAG